MQAAKAVLNGRLDQKRRRHERRRRDPILIEYLIRPGRN